MLLSYSKSLFFKLTYSNKILNVKYILDEIILKINE